MTVRRAALIVLTAGSLVPSLAPDQAKAFGPADLFYERSLISAAGQRCHLFDAATSAALAASTRQARGAALRAGADPDTLDAAESRARGKGVSVACNAPDMVTVANRVRSAFKGYARLDSMSFPGGAASWRADRPVSVGAGWRLSQPAQGGAGRLTFGIASTLDGTEALTAVAAWPGALGASGARLVLRDPAKAPRAYVDPRRPTLIAQTPPRAVTRAFLASMREAAPAALLPPGSTTGALFRFPAAAAAALDQLDPREALVLELVYPTRDGERVETIPLEVGDFAAGRAFLSVRR